MYVDDKLDKLDMVYAMMTIFIRKNEIDNTMKRMRDNINKILETDNIKLKQTITNLEKLTDKYSNALS